MATFATLKLSTAVKPTHMPAVQMRRNKLAKRLWEQAELVLPVPTVASPTCCAAFGLRACVWV